MPADEKLKIRQYVREARRAIPAEERPLLSAALAGRLTTLPEFAGVHCVLGYVANAEEIDPAPALATLAARGCRIAYPRISAPGALLLHEIAGPHELEPGPFGIMQPLMGTPVVAMGDVGAVLLPGLAFGPGGTRIGYGGGYYDRLLPQMPGAVRIGLAFDQQIVGHIPAEEHDVAVELVVTPTQVLRVGENL